MKIKNIILITSLFIMLFVLCSCNKQSSKDTPSDNVSTSKKVQTVEIELSDGNKKIVKMQNGFYPVNNDGLLTVTTLEYIPNKPEAGNAKIKLIFNGNSEFALAFLIKKDVLHGDYKLAWESSDSVIYANTLNADGIYGTDGEWFIPENLLDYEIRVFDDPSAEHPLELAFIPLIK